MEGVTAKDDKRVKHRVGSGWPLQVADRWTGNEEPQRQTVLEVCKTLPEKGTVTQV